MAPRRRPRLALWLFATTTAMCGIGSVWAQTSPVGLWTTFDDDSGKPKALVRIQEIQGSLQGRIERLLDPEESPMAVCSQCTDERRNQPMLGMIILRHAIRQNGLPERWEGGDILDPENGKVYRVRLTLSPDKRHLDVRGYIGSPLLGRSQTWERAD